MSEYIDLSDYDLENAQDPIAVEPGEYQVRIIECDGKRENSSGNPYVLPRFELCDEPLAKDFTLYLPLPHGDMDAKQKMRTVAKLKNFCACFGIAFQGFDPEDLAGTEGWVILGKDNDDEYGEQNFIKSFVSGA